jgi:uncharacterized membrane protein YoaK (UPF0700 family)
MRATAEPRISRPANADPAAAPDGLRADAPGLLVVCGLATLAGAVDACAIRQTKDIFVSFMSGNTTMFGVALAQDASHRLQMIGGVLASFVAGAAIGTVIRSFAGARHLPAVVLAVAAVLVGPAAFPAWPAPALALGMGMLNTAAQAAGPMQVSLTYVTGTLVKFGQGLGWLLCGRATDWRWLAQTVPWGGMLAGAVAATAALNAFGDGAFALLPVLAVLLAALTWRSGPHRPL